MEEKFDIEQFQNYCEKKVNNAFDELEKSMPKWGTPSEYRRKSSDIFRMQKTLYNLLFHIADKITSYKQLVKTLESLKENCHYDPDTENKNAYQNYWKISIDALIKEIQES